MVNQYFDAQRRVNRLRAFAESELNDGLCDFNLGAKMKPVNFKHSNKTLQPSGATYSENVTGVEPLHIFTDGEQCVSCWRMTWMERLSLLIFGRVWVAVLTGQTQPPIFVIAAKTYLRES